MNERKWPKRIGVVVTRKDIRDGRPSYANSCPIARAARRALHTRSVSVCGSIEVGPFVEYILPEKAHKFIAMFDDSRFDRKIREKCRPFSFVAVRRPKT